MITSKRNIWLVHAQKMRYIKYLLIFLRIHGLLVSQEINKAGFFDTLRIVYLAFPPWIVLFTSIAYAYVHFDTASLADMTDFMCTNFICLIVVINNVILAIKKFEIRAVVSEMQEMVKKRNVFVHFSPVQLNASTINIVTKYHLFQDEQLDVSIIDCMNVRTSGAME